jgi:oligopeptide/dipeptide ABC transporter ATP-binding protein
MSILGIKDLQVRFPSDAWVLRGLDLHVKAGERIAIVGESGCGKTTLVRSILGLLKDGARVQGRLQLLGKELSDASPRDWRAIRGQKIGFVPQNPLAALNPLASVGTQLAEAWTAHGKTISMTTLATMLEDVGIGSAIELLGRRPAYWSGGMLQRALIVAATALRPSLVLADEPTSAVDQPLARQMLRLLADRADALIAVTHDLDLVDGLFDRVIVLYAGRIVENASAEDFFRQPRHPYSRALLAALPKPGQLPEGLDGDPPSPRHPDLGCAFAPRCARVTASCQQIPQLADGVACRNPVKS